MWPTNDKKTNCRTIQAFIDTYSGPEFTMHYKYSYILVCVYVTFLFGPGLPILFPIAFFSILGLYITERLMVAYSYMKPPMIDSEINQQTLKMMFGAPILYMCMGMWLFSN